MKFHVNSASKNIFVYGIFIFVLLSVFSITLFAQDQQSCPRCPCCAKPPRCTGDVFKPVCESSPSCTCDCSDPMTCSCYKNVCVIKCYDLSNKSNNKVSEAGLLTLSIIKDERITEQDLIKNRDEYVSLLDKLLSNRIADKTYEVEYLSEKVQIGLSNEGFGLVSQFKENLRNGTPNSRIKRQNILQIIRSAVKNVFT